MEENRPTKGPEALNFTSNGNGTCYVSGIGTCEDKHIIIPDAYDGERVTGIGELAFYKCAELTKIELPDCMTSIGDSAFQGCVNLKKLEIPDGVKSIGNNTFQGCLNLTEIEIPNSMTHIGSYAFLDCPELKTIRFLGTKEQWEEVSKGEHWNLLAPAEIVFAPPKPKKIKGSKNLPIFHDDPSDAPKNKRKRKIIFAVIPMILLLIGGILFATMHRHDYVTQVTAPTCTDQGHTTYTCACGESYVDNITEALGHTPGKEATCTTSQNCTDCNLELQAALGHTAGEEATCTTSQNCTVCNAELKAALGHKPGAEATCTEPSNCTVCGEMLANANGHVPGNPATCTTAQTCLVCKMELQAELGHTPGAEATCTTSQNCTVCNAELKAALGHTPGAEATCTTTQNCTVCNAELKAALGHKPGAEATCITTQNCTVCNAELQAALGHTPGAEATCTTSQNCTVCNTELKAALGHKPGAEATCTEPSNCTVCGEMLANANGHVPGNPATCTTAQTCLVCKIELQTAFGHTAGEEATCTTTQNCTVCNAELKAAFGHMPEWEIVIEATKTEDGFKVQKCSGCGEKFAEEVIPATGSLGLAFTSNGDGTCYVSGIGDCTHTDIIIPSISTEGDTVIGIDRCAFKDCTNLTSITISDTITYIGVEAFMDCENLETVTIGNGVKNIYSWAFYRCYKLRNVTMGDSVMSIGLGAFQSCVNLMNITIPKSVTNINQQAFLDCQKLVEVYNNSTLNIVKGESDYGCVGYYALNVNVLTSIESNIWIDENEYVFYEEGDICFLMGYIGNDTGLKLPSSCNGKKYAIYKYAFYECASLTSIYLDSSVTTIGDWAFGYCSNLRTIQFNGTRTEWRAIRKENDWDSAWGPLDYTIIYLGEVSQGLDYTLSDDGTYYIVSGLGTCTDIDIVIPSTYNGVPVKSIGFAAFSGCSELTSIIIPNTIMSIDGCAFYGCTGLTSITIPNSVTSIYVHAFYGCTGLTSIIIPDSVTSIGSGAFRGCTGLTSITLPFLNTHFGYIFGASSYEHNSENIPTSLKTVVITGGSSIGSYAFASCFGLVSITIPDSVTSIGDDAFAYCSGLTSIMFNGTIAQWNAISKGFDWKYNVPATEVVCSDGSVSLN